MKTKLKTTLALFAAFCGLQLFTATPAMAGTNTPDENGIVPYTWITFDELAVVDPIATSGSAVNSGSCANTFPLTAGKNEAIVANDKGGKAWRIGSASVNGSLAASDSAHPSTYIVRVSFNGQTISNERVIWACNGQAYGGPSLTVQGGGTSDYTVRVRKCSGKNIQSTEIMSCTISKDDTGYHWFALTTVGNTMDASVFYLDGVIQTRTTLTTAWRGSNQNGYFTFGKTGGNGNDSIPTGILYDDIRMYSQVLSAGQIANIAGAVASGYDKFINNPGVVTWAGASGKQFTDGTWYIFSIATGADTETTVVGSTATKVFPCYEGTSITPWHAFCTASSFNKYKAPGYVLRFSSDKGQANKALDARYSPAAFGGMIVETGATGFSFAGSGSGRNVELGDNTGSLDDWFIYKESFTFDRNGTCTLYGPVNFDIASGATVVLNANRSTSSQLPVLANNKSTQLKMHGEGTLSVGTLTATGNVTLDYTDLATRTANTPYINGTVVIDDSTVIKLPSTVTAGNAYKMATAISGPTSGQAKLRTIYVGGVELQKAVTFDNANGTITYADNVEYNAPISDSTGTKNLTELSWDKPFSPTALDVAIITIGGTVTGEVVLNIDNASTLEIGTIKVNCTGDATLKLTGGNPQAITKWDFEGMKGRVTFGFVPEFAKITKGTYPRLGLGYAYTGTIATGYEYLGEGNVLTLPTSAQSGFNVAMGGSGTFTGNAVDGDFNADSTIIWSGAYQPAASGNAYLGLTDGTLTIPAGANVSVPHVRINNNGTEANDAAVSVAGKLVVTSTCGSDCYNNRGSYVGILFGHWKGSSSLNVTGEFLATNSWLQTAFSANGAQITVDGGTLLVRGLNTKLDTGKTNPTLTVQNNGVLSLAEGFANVDKLDSVTFNGGTLTAYSYNSSTGYTWSPTTTTVGANGMTIDVPTGFTITATGAISGSGAITTTGTGTLVLSGSASGFSGVLTVASGMTVKIGDASWLTGGKLKFTDDTCTLVIYERTSYDGRVNLVLASESAQPIITVKNSADESHTYTGVKVTGKAPNITVTYDQWLDGKGAWLDYTFSLDTYQERLLNNTVITNAGSGGSSISLTYDGSFRATSSYNTANGMLLAKSTPYRPMNGTSAWPSQYSVAVYANMPDVENGVLVAFGSSSTGSTKGWIALIRGSTSQAVKLAKGVGDTTPTGVTADIAAEEATTKNHLILFTNDGAKIRVYCDGDYVAELDAVTLGEGFQIGSIHGGLNNTGLVRIDAISEQAKKDAVEVQMIRVFKGILGENAIKQLKEDFPYVSANGLSERTLTAATENWSDEKWSVTYEKVTTQNQPPREHSEIKLTADVDSELTVDATASYGKLTVNEGSDIVITGTTHKVTFVGAVKIEADVTIGGCTTTYQPVDFSGVGVTIANGAALTYDFSSVDVDALTTQVSIQLTGMADAGLVAEGKLVVKMPTPTKAYWIATTEYTNGKWYAVFGPNHDPGSQVYAKAGTTDFTDATVVQTAEGVDTVMFAGDTLVITNASTVTFNQTVALGGIRIDDGATVSVQNGTDGYAIDGDTITVNNGKLRLVENPANAKVGTVTINISQNGNLDATGWVNVAGTMTVNSGYTKTVFTNTGSNPLCLTGTGKIIKGGSGVVTFDCFLNDRNSASDVHDFQINGGTLVVKADATAHKLGAVTGSGTLSIPAGATIAPTSVSSKITGAGTIDTANFAAYPDATTKPASLTGWTGKVIFKATDSDVADLGARINAWGVSGSTVELGNVGTSGSKGQGQGTYLNGTVTVNPKVILTGTAYLNNGGSNKTGTFTEISGTGTLSCEWTGSQIYAVTTLTNFTGNLNYSRAVTNGITITTLALDATPAVNDKLVGSTTSTNLTITAITANGTDITSQIVQEARTDGIYSSLTEEATKAKIGENRYATVQAAIDVVNASGGKLTLRDIVVSEGAEIPEGYKLQDGYLIRISDQVAIIGEKYYLTLASAVEAVTTDQTIRLLKDCAETITTAKTFSFDLNGHTYSGAATISAGGILTLVGGESAAYTASGKFTVAGTLKTTGKLAMTASNKIETTGTLEIVSGETSFKAGENANGICGTLTIDAGATFVNTRETDALHYNGNPTVNVKGTLSMGTTRWTMGAGCKLNLYPGAILTGDGQNSGTNHGAIDYYQANTNFKVVAGDTTEPISLGAAMYFRDSGDTTLTFETPVTLNITNKLWGAKTLTLTGVTGSTAAISSPAFADVTIAVSPNVTLAPTVNIPKLTLNAGATIKPADESFQVTGTFTKNGAYHIDGSLVLTDTTKTYTLITTPTEPSIDGVTATDADGRAWDLRVGENNNIEAYFVDRPEIHWDGTQWVDKDDQPTTPTENSIIRFNDGDDVPLTADVTVHSAYVASGATAALTGQNYLKAGELDVPAGTTLELKSNADIGATTVVGAGTIKYNAGQISYTNNVLTDNKLSGFTGILQVTSGRMQRNTALTGGYTVQIVNGGQLYVKGGTWTVAIDASGNGWTGEVNEQAKTPLRLEGGTLSGAFKAVGTTGSGYYSVMTTGNTTITNPSQWDVTGDVWLHSGNLQLGNNDGTGSATYTFGDSILVASGKTLTVKFHTYGSISGSPSPIINLGTEVKLNGGTIAMPDGSIGFAKVNVLADSTITAHYDKGQVINYLTGAEGTTLTFSGGTSGYHFPILIVKDGDYTGKLVMSGSNGNDTADLYINGLAMANGTVELGNNAKLYVQASATIGNLIGNSRNIGGNNNTVLTLKGGSAAGIITGGISLEISGDFAISGDNTYSGGTAANSGTVTLGHVNALGTGTVVVNGGTIDFGGFAPTNTFTLTSGKVIVKLTNEQYEAVLAGTPINLMTVSNETAPSADMIELKTPTGEALPLVLSLTIVEGKLQCTASKAPASGAISATVATSTTANWSEILWVNEQGKLIGTITDFTQVNSAALTVEGTMTVDNWTTITNLQTKLTITGAGRVAYTTSGTAPAYPTWNWAAGEDGWTGTYALSGFNGAATKDTVGGTGWELPKYYNSTNSVFEFSGTVTGGYTYKAGETAVETQLGELALVSSGSIKISDGYSNYPFTFTKISGNGTLTFETTGNVYQNFRFVDVASFSGTINNASASKFVVVLGGNEYSGSVNGGISFTGTTTLNSAVTLTAASGFKVLDNATVTANSIDRFSGTTDITVSQSGTIVFTSTTNTDERTDKNYSRVKGTGTIKYQGTGWRALPKEATRMPASTLQYVIEQADGVVATIATGTTELGTLSGSKNLRTDLETGNERNIRVTQTHNSTWDGIFTKDKDRMAAFKVAGSGNEKMLTLTGTFQNNDTLEIESTGSVNLTGTWKGPVTLNGELAGTGTVDGAVTFGNSATLWATNGTLTVGSIANNTIKGTVRFGSDVTAETLNEQTVITLTTAVTAGTRFGTVHVYAGDTLLGDAVLRSANGTIIKPRLVKTFTATIADGTTGPVDFDALEWSPAAPTEAEWTEGHNFVVNNNASAVTVNMAKNVAMDEFSVNSDGKTLTVTKSGVTATAANVTLSDTATLVLPDGFFGGALDVSTAAVTGKNTATLAFDMGKDVEQAFTGYTADANRHYALKVLSGVLNFTYKAGDNGTPFRGRAVIADGENSVLRLNAQDATGYNANISTGIKVHNGAQIQMQVRDTFHSPIELKAGYFMLMKGCGEKKRAFDLFGSHTWTITTNELATAESPTVSYLAAESDASDVDRTIWCRKDTWTINVESNAQFVLDNVFLRTAAIAGEGSASSPAIVKTGAGELVLNNKVDPDGMEAPWTINGGKVTLLDAAAFGSGTVTIGANGTVEFDMGLFANVEEDTLAFNIANDGSASRVKILNGDKYPWLSFGTEAGNLGKIVVDWSKYPVSGLHFVNFCPKPGTTASDRDPNGRTSGWIDLKNYNQEGSVNLKDYKIYRYNITKAAKPDTISNLLDYTLEAGETIRVYISEDYANAEDHGGDGDNLKVEWWGTNAQGKVVKDGFDPIMIIPQKVNPKKYPMVMLYENTTSVTNGILDQALVPSDIDDAAIVELGANTNKIERSVVQGGVRTDYGPDVSPVYGVKGTKTDLELLNKRDGFVPANADYWLTLPINPFTEGGTPLENEIESVVIEYRDFGLNPGESQYATTTNRVVQKGDADEAIYGNGCLLWEGKIPQSFLADKAGHLIQFRARILDKGGALWLAPRGLNKDVGHMWYGFVVQPELSADPATGICLDKLQTFLLYVDNVSIENMDKDISAQDKNKLQYGARVGVYDTQTHTYYDNVRIDLRGQTSSTFKKKSHGLRFSKVAPLKCTDPFEGEEIESRKTSFIAEYGDPAFIRQTLALRVMRESGVKAPFDYPVRLYLNGEFYQLAFHSNRFTDEIVEDYYGLNARAGHSYKNAKTLSATLLRQEQEHPTTSTCEKKTPDDDNETDLSVLIDFVDNIDNETDAATLTKIAMTNFNLAAWVNYMAATKITQECDDVWTNLGIYINKYDEWDNPCGDGTMMPIAYDQNLSFGVWYYQDDTGRGRCGIVATNDLMKSHPFYGGKEILYHKATTPVTTKPEYNRGMEAILQNATYREALARRIRTLAEKFYGSDTATQAEMPVWQWATNYWDAISGDVEADHTKWNYSFEQMTTLPGNVSPIWVWNYAPTFEQAKTDLWENFIDPHRHHLFDYHAAANAGTTGYPAAGGGYATGSSALIPDTQAATETLGKHGALYFTDLNGKKPGETGFNLNVESGIIGIVNTNEVAIDVSDWTVEGAVVATFKPGTVIPANGTLWIVENRPAASMAIVAKGTDKPVIVNLDKTLVDKKGKRTEYFDTKATDQLILKDADGTPAISHEATIGTKYYITLLDAFNCAETNDIVALLTDINNQTPAAVKTSVFLYGDTNTLTGAGFDVADDAVLTIASGQIANGALGADPTVGKIVLIGGKYINQDYSGIVSNQYHMAELGLAEGDYTYQVVPGEKAAEDEIILPVAQVEETTSTTNDTGVLAFSKEWLVTKGLAKTEDFSSTEGKKQVVNNLNTHQTNKIQAWENAVLGLDGSVGTNIPVILPKQTSDATKVTFKMANQEKVSTDSGAIVTYKVWMGSTPKGKDKGSSEAVLYTEDTAMPLPKEGVQYYMLEVITTPAK